MGFTALGAKISGTKNNESMFGGSGRSKLSAAQSEAIKGKEASFIDFLASALGHIFAIPDGAEGPSPTRSSGIQFTGGSGGKGFASSTTSFRYMDATKNQGKRGVYMNAHGQTVNPFTGKPIGNDHPYAHFKDEES